MLFSRVVLETGAGLLATLLNIVLMNFADDQDDPEMIQENEWIVKKSSSLSVSGFCTLRKAFPILFPHPPSTTPCGPRKD